MIAAPVIREAAAADLDSIMELEVAGFVAGGWSAAGWQGELAAPEADYWARLEREVASAGESGRPLSIAIFDVDHFKRINDLFGHAAGDRMLRDVAGAALGAVRGGDLVGRVGGEEFAVLMPGAEPTHALAVGERIRAAVAERTGQLHDLPAVTVSVGVAFHQGLVDAQALLAQADSALYDAKAQGRDRLCLATA